MENTIYSIVDEHAFEGLTVTERRVLKDVYYQSYCLYCDKIGKIPKEKKLFFSNMRRNKIKILQVCCPYCGTIRIIITEKTIKELETINYCTSCGKSSPGYNVFRELTKIIRINNVNELGIKALVEKDKKLNKEMVSYDVYQYEVVALASIFEKVVKDFFFSFMFLNYYGIKTDYLRKLVNKSTRNDFMEIDKAKNQYKDALNVLIKELIPEDDWETLIDLCKIRNVIVHNNGLVDEQFLRTNTYNRFRDNIDGELVFIKESDINSFLKSMIVFFNELEKLFDKSCKDNKYKILAKYYLDKDKKDFDEVILM